MKSPAQQRAAEQQQSREQAIKRIMESNPNKTREQVEAYYDHLKSQGKL